MAARDRGRLAFTGFVMMSHVRLVAIDPSRPASYSRAVAGLVRDSWGCDGVLITDDFGLRAVYSGPAGLSEATVAAIEFGVDLVLVSYDPDQFFAAMYGLLQADRTGRLCERNHAASARRLEVAVPGPQGRDTMAR